MKCNKMKALAEFLGVEEEEIKQSSYNENLFEYGNQEYLQEYLVYTVEGFKIFDTLQKAHNKKKRILCFTEHKITGNLYCVASTTFFTNKSRICIHTSIYEDDIFYIIEDNEKNREIMEKII